MAATIKSGSGSGLLDLRAVRRAVEGRDVFPVEYEREPATVPMVRPAADAHVAKYDLSFSMPAAGWVRVRLVPPDRVSELMRHAGADAEIVPQSDGSAAVIETAPPGERPAGWRRPPGSR